MTVMQQAEQLLGEMTQADLLRMYPTLRSEDLANAWAYYRSHKAEIEQQISENEAA